MNIKQIFGICRKMGIGFKNGIVRVLHCARNIWFYFGHQDGAEFLNERPLVQSILSAHKLYE